MRSARQLKNRLLERSERRVGHYLSALAKGGDFSKRYEYLAHLSTLQRRRHHG